MPLKQFTGGGAKRTPKPSRPFHSKTSKSSRGRQGRKGKTTRAKKTKTTAARGHAAPAFHEQTAQPGAQHPSTAGLPFSGVGSTAGASPRPVMELSGISTATAEGLGGAILDMVGEGHLTVAHALAAWTHEQNRLANRAWRRPGGLQRMAGL